MGGGGGGGGVYLVLFSSKSMKGINGFETNGLLLVERPALVQVHQREILASDIIKNVTNKLEPVQFVQSAKRSPIHVKFIVSKVNMTLLESVKKRAELSPARTKRSYQSAINTR